MYKIYADGACSGNPGPGGWGAVVFDEQDNKTEYSGGEANTTNNRMEIMACIKGLENIPANSIVKVYTDSAYVFNCFNDEWYVKWEKNNWMRNKKDPVLNPELWKTLLKLYRSMEHAEFVKVKGHSDNEWNNRADKLAVQAKGVF